MTQQEYELFEGYMQDCMKDSAHDREHVYRVLSNALDIAETEAGVNHDILVCACLLHDIGRKEQLENPALCHAQVGGDKAYCFLLEHGYSKEFSAQVRSCIRAHRYRQSEPPETVEAKILFDADKLDVTGAIGIARTLAYQGAAGQPLYSRRSDGSISNGEGDELHSFFREYKFKLEKIYGRFLTRRGGELAARRRQAAELFYESLLNEVQEADKDRQERLKELMEQ